MRLCVRVRGRAVLLVTHQLQFAEELADTCIVLSQGKVHAQGPPSQIAAAGLLKDQGERSPQMEPTEAGAGVQQVTLGLTRARPEAKPLDEAQGEGPQAVALSEAGAVSGAAAVEAASTSTKAGADARVETKQHKEEMVAGMVAGSAAEMGRGNRRGEALRFYLRQLKLSGCLFMLLTFSGLAVCRALADWQLGRWIVDGQRLDGSALYASLVSATVAFGCSYALAFTRVVGAASRIHHVVLKRILRAPKSFFDTTPLGLLLNIFSKDMDTLDDLLPVSLTGLAKCITIVSTAMVVSAVASPLALASVPFAFFIFRRLTRFFQLSATQLKRLDKATSGPLLSLYSETLGGVTSIRAFGLQPAFRAMLLERLGTNHAAHFLWLASNRWFAARLDWLTGAIVLVVGVCILLLRDVLDPALAALALTCKSAGLDAVGTSGVSLPLPPMPLLTEASPDRHPPSADVLQMTSLFQWGFRNWAECQNHFVSVDRALSYSKAPQEPPATIDAVDQPLRAGGWPPRGELTFADVQMRYRPGLPLVLCSVDFSLAAGMKAAVVGRSGAGKSSLSVALLRLAPLEGGKIVIDGVDVATLGLTLLRRAVTLIPQVSRTP